MYSIIEQRFRRFLAGSESNMKSLGLNSMYYYANQSKFECKLHQLNNQSMYDLAQQFLQQNKVEHTQLVPGNDS